jgi:hypothetical protein
MFDHKIARHELIPEPLEGIGRRHAQERWLQSSSFDHKIARHELIPEPLEGIGRRHM